MLSDIEFHVVVSAQENLLAADFVLKHEAIACMYGAEEARVRLVWIKEQVVTPEPVL